MAKTTVKKGDIVTTQSVTAKVGQPAKQDAAGAALAKIVINLAHQEAKEKAAKQQKLRGIAESLHGLTDDGHLTFRRDIVKERDHVREELNKFGYDAKVHRIHGTAASSWFVQASNMIGLSKAIHSGMSIKYSDDPKDAQFHAKLAGQTMCWEDLLKHSRIRNNSKGKAGPSKRKAGKALPVDKIIGYASRLDVEGLQSLAVWVKNALKAQ